MRWLLLQPAPASPRLSDRPTTLRAPPSVFPTPATVPRSPNIYSMGAMEHCMLLVCGTMINSHRDMLYEHGELLETQLRQYVCPRAALEQAG